MFVTFGNQLVRIQYVDELYRGSFFFFLFSFAYKKIFLPLQCQPYGFFVGRREMGG